MTATRATLPMRVRRTSAAREYFVGLQAAIVAALEAIDGEAFRRDDWQRPAGGGGISMSIEDGRVLERAGVLFSHVTGNALPPSATAHRPQLAGRAWEALGVSLVLHPRNPYAQTVHLNIRHFVAGPPRTPGSTPSVRRSGGLAADGPDADLGFDEDARHFHRGCRDAPAPFGDELYARFAQLRRVLFPQASAGGTRHRRDFLRRLDEGGPPTRSR
jgi:coproporphyrinogen III oxidase